MGLISSRNELDLNEILSQEEKFEGGSELNATN